MLNNSYKYLSDETKSKISTLEIVPPSLYKSIFQTIAETNNIDIDDEEIQANIILGTKLKEINAINEATDKKVIQLDENTKKAIKAISEKDDAMLNEILLETEALKEEINRLKESLYKDSLTKVYNRKWLNSELLDSNEKFICDGTLFLVDMNYFKQINDTYGHIAGDKTLLYVAKHLQRLDATVVRYGGDEFMVIFNSKNLPEFSHKLHINRELILKKQLKFNKEKFRLSFSYGGVEFEKEDTFTQIFEQADALMYEDKKKIKERIKPN